MQYAQLSLLSMTALSLFLSAVCGHVRRYVQTYIVPLRSWSEEELLPVYVQHRTSMQENESLPGISRAARLLVSPKRDQDILNYGRQKDE